MKQEHIQQIFARADISQVRELLLSGIELDGKAVKQSYHDRLEDGSRNIVSRLKKFSKDEHEFDYMYDEFCEAATAYTEVFLEIGMKAGSRLLFQLLHEDS